MPLRGQHNFAKSLPYFCPICRVPVKSKVKISQNFVAFSEYMNFNSAFRIKDSTTVSYLTCNEREQL